MPLSSSLAGWLDFGLALLAFALLGLALWGLGRGTARLLRVALASGPDTFGYLWMGLASTILILALVNYFLPISPALPVGSVLYSLGALYALITLWRRGMDRFRLGYRALLYVGIMAVVGGCLAAQALLPPMSGDSGLYYLGTIRWAKEYPVVPGLGNLHGRFAFNQSLFVWVASLDFGPWRGHGFALANPFWAAALTAEALWRVLWPQRLAESPADMPTDATPVLAQAVPLFLLPPLLFIMLVRPLASAQPDITSQLLQLALFIWCARLFTAGQEADRLLGPAAVVGGLCALALTVKLSNLAFVGAAGGLALLYVCFRLGRGWGRLGRVLIWGALIVVIWFGRGLILSGCPLYPATLLCQDFPWAVSAEQAQVEAYWIYSWARQPGLHYDQVLGDWAWLKPWLERRMAERVEVLYPVALALIGLGLGAWLWRRQAQATRRTIAWLWVYWLLPVLIGLAAWFWTAPELRFAQGMIWLLPVAVWTPLLAADWLRRWHAWCVWGLFALLNGPLLVTLVLHGTPLSFAPWQGFAPIPTPALEQQTTESGLVVNVPAEGYHCWDAPLPCTPYFNPGLHLLGQGLGSGFALPPDESAAPRWNE